MPAISNITVEPSRISFTGSWVGPAPGQREHTLTRADIAGLGLNTTAAIENYVNTVWFPKEFRDTEGARTGYAAVHVFSVLNANDIDWRVRISNDPIPSNWWQNP